MLDARLISGLLRSNQLEHSGVLIFSNDRKITRRKPRSQLEVMPGRYGESTIARILAIHAVLLRRHNCLGAMPGGASAIALRITQASGNHHPAVSTSPPVGGILCDGSTECR